MSAMLAFGFVIAGIIAILVYNDASQRNLSNNTWIKSPIGWAIAVFLFMIVFLPAYYVTRGPTKKELFVYQTKYCNTCGAKIEKASNVCNQCGAKQPTI